MHPGRQQPDGSRPPTGREPAGVRPGGPPPPARELPLPRRARATHLEPQLRTPRGVGDGTPFAAFAPGSPVTTGSPVTAEPPVTAGAGRPTVPNRDDSAGPAAETPVSHRDVTHRDVTHGNVIHGDGPAAAHGPTSPDTGAPRSPGQPAAPEPARPTWRSPAAVFRAATRYWRRILRSGGEPRRSPTAPDAPAGSDPRS